VKILTLTTGGVAALAAHGITVKTQRSGGAEHEFWKHDVRTALERQGYTVTEEFPLGGGKSADLRAERAGRVLFVEVETGRSDVAANVAKYGDADLVVFFTSEDVAAQYRPLIALDRPATRCCTPADLDQLT
jgi:hypothetical protein